MANDTLPDFKDYEFPIYSELPQTREEFVDPNKTKNLNGADLIPSTPIEESKRRIWEAKNEAKKHHEKSKQAETDLNPKPTIQNIAPQLNEKGIQSPLYTTFQIHNPKINGSQIKRVIYSISNPTSGVRNDIIPQLQFNYPMMKILGFDLVQFDMDLFAWDEESYKELQDILESVYPKIIGTKKVTPKASKIEYDPLTIRGLDYFIPVKPTTPFLYWDQEKRGYPMKITWLQYNPIQRPPLKDPGKMPVSDPELKK
jgi:hypothetical protein